MNYAQIYFRKKRPLFERITESRVLFGLLAIVSLIILLVFTIAISRSVLNDPPVPVMPFPESVLNEHKHIVKTGLYIHTFQKFEMIENNFIADATVWFRYDPAQISFELIDAFSFENANLTHKSAPYIVKAENDQVFVRYDIKVEFKGDFNYQYYPFDRHRVNFVLINKKAPLDELVYVSSNGLVINKSAFTQDWKVTGLSTAFGTTKSDFFIDNNEHEITYERVVFSIDFKRASLRTIFVIFIPLFLVYAVGLLSLTFDILSQFRFILTLSLGSATALIFFSSTLAKMVPVSGIFTLADMIYILLLILIMTTLTLQVAAMHYLNNKMRITKLSMVIDETILFINIIRGLLFVFFLVVMLVIVIWIMLI